MSQARPFLSAEWRHLAMLNYVVDPELLRRYLPAGVEIDLHEGRTFVSMVGFLFLHTRVLGVGVPFHRSFEEVNLRFYVRRAAPEGWRRGVVFVREIVPRRMIATIARVYYNEPYAAMPMRHRVTDYGAEYGWHFKGRWNRLTVGRLGPAQEMVAGSEPHFIAEHYYGYNRQRNGTTMEYEVAHPPWRVRVAGEHMLGCDVAALYGPEFVEVLAAPPSSALLYEGSAVTVHHGRRVPS